jgi:signal transduction histidine kinase
MTMNVPPQQASSGPLRPDSSGPGAAPGGFFGELIDPATYRQLLYHALSLPLALTYFVVLTVSYSLGLGLLVVLVGVFVLAGALWMTLAAADLERLLGTALLGVKLERRRTLRPEGVLEWLRALLSDAGTYKAVLYLLLKLPFSLLVLVVGAVVLGAAAAMILAPILWLIWGTPDWLPVFDFGGQNAALQVGGGLYQATIWSLPVMVLAGVLLTVLGVALLNLLARAWAFLSVALLTDYGENAQALREVQALRQGAQTLGRQTLGSQTLGSQTLGNQTPGSQPQDTAGQLHSDDPAAALGELLAQGVQATVAQGALILQEGKLLAQHGLTPEFASTLSDLRPSLDLQLQPNRAHLLRNWQPDSEHSGLGAFQKPGTLVSLPVGPYQNSELHVLYPLRSEPSRRELEFWGAISNQAAVALEVSQLLRAARLQGSEQGAVQERARLARELHDSVAQALYGIALGTRAARAQLERNPSGAGENLDYAVQLADGATAEMRALLFALRPDALEEGGLVAALSRLTEMLTARYKIRSHLDTADEPDLSTAQKGALYRIAQEAAHNAVKHAQAGRIDLTLRREAGDWLLQVHDDGSGFDPALIQGGTLGLKSMRERADEMGASFDLHSSPGPQGAQGTGTTIRVRLPLSPSDGAAAPSSFAPFSSQEDPK